MANVNTTNTPLSHVTNKAPWPHSKRPAHATACSTAPYMLTIVKCTIVLQASITPWFARTGIQQLSNRRTGTASTAVRPQLPTVV